MRKAKEVSEVGPIAFSFPYILDTKISPPPNRVRSPAQKIELFSPLALDSYSYLSRRINKSLDRRNDAVLPEQFVSARYLPSPVAIEKDLIFGTRNMERLAHIFLSQGKLEEARKHFLEVIVKEHTCNESVYHGMINCCLDLNLEDEAVWACVQFATDHHRLVSAHSTHIELLMSLGRYREAVAICNKALKIFPNNETILNLRGKCHYERKEYRQAAGDFHKTIEINRAQRGQSTINGTALQSWRTNSIF